MSETIIALSVGAALAGAVASTVGGYRKKPNEGYNLRKLGGAIITSATSALALASIGDIQDSITSMGALSTVIAYFAVGYGVDRAVTTAKKNRG